MNSQIQSISAVTIVTSHMARSVKFYQSIGLELHRGGPQSPFSTFAIGPQHINLREREPHESAGRGNGLVIFRVANVDGLYERVLQLGHTPEFAPRDAEWGERYFHLLDPDGNELSFAQPL